jgi:hypothetical protein
MQDEKYFIEILRCLDGHEGGRAPTQIVYDIVRSNCRDELTAHDFADLDSGEKRLPNKIRQIRRALISYRLMEPMRVRGIWQITQRGRKYVKAYPRVKLLPGFDVFTGATDDEDIA